MEEEAKVNLDIPALPYFSFGNVYTGSCGGAFRYRIKKEGDGLLASVWYADVCCELAEDRTEKTFPETDEGLRACVLWIEDLAKKAGK